MSLSPLQTLAFQLVQLLYFTRKFSVINPKCLELNVQYKVIFDSWYISSQDMLSLRTMIAINLTILPFRGDNHNSIHLKAPVCKLASAFLLRNCSKLYASLSLICFA